MDDPAHDSGPLTTEDFWMSMVFLLILIGLFVAEICVNYHPVKLTALFIVLFWMPLLVVHELGHALMAALLGWRVHGVVLGMGRPLARFHVGRTPVEVRLFPVEGFVLSAPTNLRAPRLKSALVYFGGPGAELLVVALLALILGPATLLSRTENMGLLAAQSLAVAALLGVVLNLVPHYDFSGNRRRASDGMGILQSFLRPRADYALMIQDPEAPWRAEPDEEATERDDW